METSKFSTLRKTLNEIQKLQAKSREGVFFQLSFFNGGKGKSSIDVKVHHDFNPPQSFSFTDGKLPDDVNIREVEFYFLKRHFDYINDELIDR